MAESRRYPLRVAGPVSSPHRAFLPVYAPKGLYFEGSLKAVEAPAAGQNPALSNLGQQHCPSYPKKGYQDEQGAPRGHLEPLQHARSQPKSPALSRHQRASYTFIKLGIHEAGHSGAAP